MSLAPLYLYPDASQLLHASNWPPGDLGRTPNFTKTFVTSIESKLQMNFVSDGSGDLNNTFGPDDIFCYMLAVFFSSTYRNRYLEFLNVDYPRLPLTSDVELFRSLVRLGGELVALHLMEFALGDEENSLANWPRYSRLVQFSGSNRVVGKFPSAKNAWREGRVAINRTSSFTGVPADVWNFQIGGYQVCHKWLKDRKGRTLSDADIHHYCKIVTALHQTIRLMAEIDEVIEEHGGWPIE
jgi:predicted helicase